MAGIAQGFTLLGTDGNPISAINGYTFSLLANGLTVANATPLPVAEELAGVQVTNSTTLAGAAAGSVTLPGAAGKTTYVRGFVISSVNATAVVSGLATLTGTISGALNFEYVQLTTGSILAFAPGVGVAASAQNTAIVLNFPAITGGAATALSIWGVQI